MTNGDDVISVARAQIGKPYVWGATGPNSFDCSGLVQFAFQHAGYSAITRTTYSQISQGQPVTTPAPGDLWFPESGHVGIATSATTVIHAPEPGKSVIERNMWTSKPVAIRRLVPPGNGSGNVASGGEDGTASSLGGLFDSVGTLFSFLTDPKMWLRVAMFAAGLGLSAVGVFMVVMGIHNANQAVSAIGTHAKKLVKSGTESS